MTIKIRRLILPALLVSQMCFIFIMSSFGHNSSDAQSNLFVDFIAQNFPHVRHDLENNLISLSTLIFLVRKTAHFTEYAILGSLFFLNLRNWLKLNNPLTEKSKLQTTKTFAKKAPLGPLKYALAMSVLLSFLYACTDEIHQIFVPGRSAQFRDILIDTLGASFGCLLIHALLTLFTKLKSNSKTQNQSPSQTSTSPQTKN